MDSLNAGYDLRSLLIERSREDLSEMRSNRPEYVVLLLGPCFAAFIFYRYEMWLGTKDGIDLQLQVLWVIDGLITIIVILVLHLTWIGTGKDRDMKAALPWLARHLLFQNERHTKECKIEASDQLSNVVSEDHRSVI